MSRIRFYLGHVALGLVVGIGSAELWLHVLRRTVPEWLTGVVAVAFVLVVEAGAAGARRRRAARRPRRHAHARPTTTTTTTTKTRRTTA